MLDVEKGLDLSLIVPGDGLRDDRVLVVLPYLEADAAVETDFEITDSTLQVVVQYPNERMGYEFNIQNDRQRELLNNRPLCAVGHQTLRGRGY